MHISICAALAFLSAPFFAHAQEANPFKVPSQGLSATGGEPLKLEWTPTTQGTISLILRSGTSDNLNEGTIIVSGYSNSGSYTWTPSNSLTRGSDYTVEIVDDSNPDSTNYTPYFVLNTTTTEAHSTSEVTLGAPSATLISTTASPTGKASNFLSTVTSTKSAAKSSSMGTTATSGSSASMRGASAETSPTSGSGASSLATSMTSAVSASQNSGSPASASSGPASASSQGTGAKATAMAGMLGVIALGALAL